MGRGFLRGGLLLLLALALAVAMPHVDVHASEEPPPIPTDWLGVVNWYRTSSGLPAVSGEQAWSSGIALHLQYLRLTPPEYRTGEYANAHYENPASPYYTPEGDQAGRSSNLAFYSSSERDAIEVWMAAPFHAIGILRPNLEKVGFARDEGGFTGLDVIRGLRGASPSLVPILFPGDGARVPLNRFIAEAPNPLESCPGFSFGGLPLIAMLPAPPTESIQATLQLPDEITLAGPSSELCVITSHSFVTTDPIYGDAGLAILKGSNAVFLIANRTLKMGNYRATLTETGSGDVTWSFGIGTWAGVFSDDDSSIFEMDHEWLAAQGITKGCSTDGSLYCPRDLVTRGQMAAFLSRALNLSAAGPNPFTDTVGSIFEADIAKVAQAGITQGCNAEGTMFCPDDLVTRGQMAAFLSRGLNLPDGAVNTFVDVDGSIFEADIAKLAETGITRGCTADGTKFCPNDFVTRGQMAAFLRRALE